MRSRCSVPSICSRGSGPSRLPARHACVVAAGLLGAATVASLIAAPRVGDATFGQRLTWLYLDVVAAAAAGTAYLVGEGSFGWALGVLGLGMLLLARGAVIGYAIELTLLRADGHRLRLKDLPRDAEHVLCATDLHGRHHVYFGPDFVYSFGFGLGQRPELPLGAAMQASANLPFAFPPRPMRHGPFAFTGGRYKSPVLALTDGGVYDNMAEEWLLSYRMRAIRFAERAEELADSQAKAAALARAQRVGANQPDFLVVVNASGPLGFKFAWTTFLPILGELLALLRVKSILYDNGNSARRRLLVGDFVTRARTGILVHIDTDPWQVIEDGRAEEGVVGDRANAAAAVLHSTPGLDRDTTVEGVSAGTVLYPLPKGRAGTLAERSYALAMVLGHVWHDLPIFDIPPIEEFHQMERGHVPASRPLR